MKKTREQELEEETGEIKREISMERRASIMEGFDFEEKAVILTLRNASELKGIQEGKEIGRAEEREKVQFTSNAIKVAKETQKEETKAKIINLINSWYKGEMSDVFPLSDIEGLNKMIEEI